MKPYLTGNLILAGDIEIHDEAEPTSGVLICIEREALRSTPHLPMYEPVVVVPLTEFEGLLGATEAGLNFMERVLTDEPTPDVWPALLSIRAAIDKATGKAP